MTESIFFRIEGEGKEITLLSVIRDLALGTSNSSVHTLEVSNLEEVPLAPFAYWVSEAVRKLFVTLPRFEGGGRTAKQGLATADDFRFVRAMWETPIALSVDPERIWLPFAKGGSYSPFYADVFLQVNWGQSGDQIRFFGDPNGVKPLSRPQNTNFYLRPALTWPLRTTSGLALRAMPAGCVFGHKGPAAFTDGDRPNDLLSLLALSSSQPFHALVALQLAAAEAAARSYEVGVIQRTVVPTHLDNRLADLALVSWTIKRSADTSNLTSHAFVKPALAQPGLTLSQSVATRATMLAQSNAALAAAQSQIDDLAFRYYGLSDGDRKAIERAIGSGGTVSGGDTQSGEDPAEVSDYSTADTAGYALVSDLMDYAVGVAFGRWDIRYANGETPAPEVPGPFAELPVCPSGMLLGNDRLPLTPEAGRRLRAENHYPLDVAWDGILLDDSDHPFHLERRVHDALEVLWADRTGSIEHEACALLGVPTLREYLCRPAHFFADHLKRHSKSRRQAPIFWQLSSPGGHYSLWLYYHRLHDDTIYRCIEIVKERLKYEEMRLARFTTEFGETPPLKQRKLLNTQRLLVDDINAFYAEVSRVAPLWRPDLNDGVIINLALLWRLIPYKPWQMAVKACWEDLVAGKYDWAHLAMRLWPERVISKCTKDRSLAIAHGLNDTFWVQDASGKWLSRAFLDQIVDVLVKERTSVALKSALRILLDAPSSANKGSNVKRGAKRKSDTTQDGED